MSERDNGWRHELQRRIAVYDEIESKDDWRGQMRAGDYWGLLALTVVLVAGFWACPSALPEFLAGCW